MTGRSLTKERATAQRALAAMRKDLTRANFTHEAMNVRSRAEVMRALAREVKDRTLEIDAAEVRVRAERRLGQMITAQKETVGLAKGTAGRGRPRKGGSRNDPPKHVPTLADVLGDKHKHLAQEARTLAKWPDNAFEDLLAEWREEMERNNQRVTFKLLRKRAQTELDPTAARLTSSGRKLEKTLLLNAHAPPGAKLGHCESIIEVVVEGMRKLEKIAAQIGKPSGVEQFRMEFGKIEERVVQLADDYWATKALLMETDYVDKFGVSSRQVVEMARASLAERGVVEPTKHQLHREVRDTEESLDALHRLHLD